MTSSELSAIKHGYSIQVPDEVLAEDEFGRRHEAARAVIEQRAAERKAACDALMARFREVCCPAALVVVELHASNADGECGGCDVAGYEAEQPDWPCSTIEALAGHYGIEVKAP